MPQADTSQSPKSGSFPDGSASINQLVESDLGICIKNTSKTVLFQNHACIQRCGRRQGLICSDGCMKTYPANASGATQQGICQSEVEVLLSMVTEKLQSEPSNYETVVINNGEMLVTIQCPIGMKLRHIMRSIAGSGLTQSEMNVLRLRISKKSNRQIASMLFISLSTLKTHWNNIYKKIPVDIGRLLKRG